MLTFHKKPIFHVLSSLVVVGMLSPVAAAQEIPPLPGIPNINNPYTTQQPFAPGSQLSNPYGAGGIPGFGGFAYPIDIFPYSGIADIVNAQGQFMMSQETARIMREKAYQEFLRSQKARIEFERWVRDTTPTFTETQRKIARETLKRIQDSATPTEIWSGRAPNILLKDLFRNQEKVHMDRITLDENTLRQLNVTVANNGSLGLLRDDGRIQWPPVLKELADEKTLREIESNSQDLISQARVKPTVNPQTHKDLETRVRGLQKTLEANILKVPARQYLQAQRFLDNFLSAIRALESPNVARHYFKYRDWAKGEKTIEELVNYMRDHGLTFGPAVDGDEAAYDALYSALARYSYAYNTQIARKNGTPKE